jgi:dGTPase
MDWADDVTYAVHDVNDFFRAGIMPLDRLADRGASRERKKFYDGVFSREEFSYSRSDLEQAFENLTEYMPFTEPYSGTTTDRASLRGFSAGLISRYLRDGIHLADKLSPGVRRVQINPGMEKEVIMLKQLTWEYVILNPALATQQHGQRNVIKTLFHVFLEAAEKSTKSTLFPHAFREMLKTAANRQQCARIVCDYLAGMTERQATGLYLKLIGTVPGSGMH